MKCMNYKDLRHCWNVLSWYKRHETQKPYIYTMCIQLHYYTTELLQHILNSPQHPALLGVILGNLSHVSVKKQEIPYQNAFKDLFKLSFKKLQSYRNGSFSWQILKIRKLVCESWDLLTLAKSLLSIIGSLFLSTNCFSITYAFQLMNTHLLWYRINKVNIIFQSSCVNQ